MARRELESVKDRKISVGVSMTLALFQELRELAKAEGKSLSALVNELIERGLKDVEAQRKQRR